MTVFETIWNCREKMKTMSIRHAVWRYLKRFKTAMRKNSTCFDLIKRVETFHCKCENRDGNCCILTLFETIFWNNREIFENKDDKWCILTLFETIFWNNREIFENKDDKWCILTLFDTIFWPAEKFWKAMVHSDAFWDLCSMPFRVSCRIR